MLQVRKLVLAVAAATSMASGMAHALGLGEVSVKSALNEPLVAEIELLDTKGLSTEEIRSTLASAEDFSRAGVDRQFFLNNLKFTPVVGQNGKSFVRVTSTQAVREPFLNFLLEVYWPAGRVLKEYTLLLDPPLYTPQEVVYGSAPVTTSVPAATRMPEPRPVTSQRSQPAVASAPRQQTAAAPLGDSYRVQQNDTLWEIALRADRAGGSVHQTMLAIQDLNPDAFIDGNLNRLKSGQTLKLPNAEQIRQRSRGQAVTEFQAQENAWRSGTPVQRQLDARRRETAAAAPAQVEQGDNLRLVAAETGKSEVGSDSGSNNRALENQLALVKEQLDSSLRQNQDLSSRVEELNSQVEKLQRLLELKNTQLASLQDMAEGEVAVAAEPAINEPVQQETVAAVEPETAVEEPNRLAAEIEPAAAETVEAVEAELEPVTEQTAEPVVVAEPAPQPAVVNAKPAPKPAPVVFDPVPEPKSFLDELMENPLLLPGAGAGAALLLLLLLISRRNKAKQQEILAAEETDDFVAQPVDGFAEAASFDTLDGVLDDLATDAEEPAEFVDVLAETPASATDPISEAENYISFGRFNQAIDVLLTAIDAEPQRQDLRFKLLEVYADLEDHNAFQAQVSELSAMGVAQSELDALRARFPYLMGEDDGGLSLDDLMLDLPSAAEPASAQQHETGDLLSDDIPGLDDLLGEMSVPAEAPAFVEPEVAEAKAVSTEQDEFSSLLEAVEAELDADFSLDTVEPVLELPPLQDPAAELKEDSLELSGLDDLSLEGLSLDEKELTLDDGFSLDDLQLESFASTAEEQPDFDLDFDLSQPLDEAEQPAAEALDTSALELELESLDDSFGELKANVQEALQAPKEPATELEQMLELDSGLDLSTPELAAAPVNDGDEMLAELDDDFSFLQGDDEDKTKLDLASAWIDMGDVEGAREILDEVIRDGAPEHQEHARELLAKLVD